jgi:hypothetical protein
VSYTDSLIALYGGINAMPKDRQVIILRVQIIRALKNVEAPSVSSFLGKIIDTHLIRPETDEAISVIGSLCLTDLAPNLHSYITDITSQINNNKFPMDDPSKKPIVSPSYSINNARSVIQSLGRSDCGKLK